jgi:outer membrane usher protein
LPERFTAFNGGQQRSPLPDGRGALLNYDVYTNNTENIGTRASLWHEFRYFSGNMTFSSTGTAISAFRVNLRNRMVIPVMTPPFI